MSNEDLRSFVRTVVQELWPSVQEMEGLDGTTPFLFGRFGDVDLELKTRADPGPLVRADVNLARCVPFTEGLIHKLNSLNERAAGTVVGISPDEHADTVRVKIAASTFGGFIDEASVRAVVETTVWPANVLLTQGFLATYGGELAALVQLRSLIATGDLLPEGQRSPALLGLQAQAAELQARVERNDVGRLPGS